jgi:hypothetical protein
VTRLQRLNKNAVTALLVLEMLTQGVVFDSRSVRRLPVDQSMIDRALRGLIKAGVVTRSEIKTKYLLTDEFLEALRREITRSMPRGDFVHYPDLSVFDVCGIGSWSAEELETYVARLRQRWTLRKGFS